MILLLLVLIFLYIKYLTILKVLMHASACNKQFFVWLGNNPLAKGGGLFIHAEAQTISS